MESPKDCKYFDACSSPICPKSESSLKHCAWFPDEEICRIADAPPWVSRQKKLSRKLNFESGCFTVRMLERNCKVTATLKGIDPDRGDPHKFEDAWLKDHPEYKASKKQIENARKMALLSREDAPDEGFYRAFEGIPEKSSEKLPSTA